MVESTWRTEVAAFCAILLIIFLILWDELDPIVVFARSCHSFVLWDGELVQNPLVEIFASTKWTLFVLRHGCGSADSKKPHYS